MLKLVLRLPYYVNANTGAAAPVLLFLHGIGEGFVSEGECGHDRALRHVPPRHIGSLRPDHQLRSSFTLIAPQLPDRATEWSDVADDVASITGRYRTDGGKLYIMGFSKGGLGSFQLAGALGAHALVAIDAAPMTHAPQQVISRWVDPLGRLPFWAIYTGYENGTLHHTIQVLNELLPAQEHKGLTREPAPSTQARTLLPAPDEITGLDDKHVWVCEAVSTAEAPYRWLLRH